MDRQDAICGPRNGAANTEALSGESAGELRRLMRVDAARLTVPIQKQPIRQIIAQNF
jgi:hypothetical protein